MFSADDVRTELQRQLDQPVDNSIWTWLDEDEGEVMAAVDRANTDRQLDDAVRDLIDQYNSGRRLETRIHGKAEARVPRPTLPPDRRAYAVAEVLKIEAAAIPEVKQFRASRLASRLLAPQEVHDWVLDAYRDAFLEAPPLTYVVVPEHDRAGEPVDWIRPELRYKHADEPGSRSVRIGASGALAELKQIAGQLESLFNWKEEDASTFVLTGHVPVQPRARATSLLPRSGRGQARMSLDISTRVSPADVASFYAKARRHFEFAHERRLDEEWRASLAPFAASARVRGLRWREAMNEWNKREPAHTFTDYRTFQRACSRAYERTMGQPLRWRERPAEPST
jgi:hypothetical protein